MSSSIGISLGIPKRPIPCSCYPRTQQSARSFATSSRLETQKVAPLRSRRLLRCAGRDSSKFLQGMVSQDMGLLDTKEQLIYTGFMNAAGRILHDAFIHRSPSAADEFLIEHDESASAALTSHLKRFILRSKVKLSDASEEYNILSAFRPLESLSTSTNDALSADPRTKSMGYRILAASNQAINSLQWQEEIEEVEEPEYQLHRIRLGVAEGPNDLISGSSIPLESNLDYMGAIDFRKGCYVGQELTSRTHHTGVTRKRIVPVRIFPSTDPTPNSLLPTTFLDPRPSTTTPGLPAMHTDVRPAISSVAKPRPSGKLLSTISVSSTEETVNIGLALLRLEQMDIEDGTFAVGEGWKVKGFRPEWWNDRVVELGKRRG